jgi:hypothetical protein
MSVHPVTGSCSGSVHEAGVEVAVWSIPSLLGVLFGVNLGSWCGNVQQYHSIHRRRVLFHYRLPSEGICYVLRTGWRHGVIGARL